MSKVAVQHCRPIKFGVKIRPQNMAYYVHVDAEPTRILLNYRKILKEVDEQLVSQDLKSLKFLCCDFLPLSKLERMTRGLELMSELESKGLIKEDCFHFLAEILFRVGRNDLLKKLRFNSQDIEYELQKMGGKVSPYRVLLLEICDDVTKGEVDQMKFLAGGRVSRKQLEKVADGIDLMVALEKGEIISPTIVDPLLELVKDLERHDLISKIQQYQGVQRPVNTYKGGGQGQVHGHLSFHPQPVNPPYHIMHEPRIEHDKLRRVEVAPPIEQGQHGRRNLQQKVSSNDAITVGDRDWAGFAAGGDVLPNEIASLGTRQANAGWQAGMARTGRSCQQSGLNMPNVPQVPLVPLMVAMAAGEGEGAPVVETDRQDVPMDRHPRYSEADRILLRQSPIGGEQYSAMTQRQGINTHRLIDGHSAVPLPTNIHDQSRLRVLRHSLPAVRTAPSHPGALYQKDGDVYKMTSVPRGYCIIINNEKFYKIYDDPTSKKMPDREGSSVDKDNLVLVFEKLGFKTYVYENLDHSEMDRTLKHYSINVGHEEYDVFACCILTHGIQGMLYGSDGKVVGIQTLTQSFKAVTCPSLVGKPKLFFIQACQGKEKQPAVEMDAPHEDNPNTLPNEADFLLGYATVPGFVSFRSKTHGSWYITTLCRMLEQHANSNMDLLQILTKVNNEVSKGNAFVKDSIYKQVPAPQYTLRKLLYFHTV